MGSGVGFSVGLGVGAGVGVGVGDGVTVGVAVGVEGAAAAIFVVGLEIPGAVTAAVAIGLFAAIAPASEAVSGPPAADPSMVKPTSPAVMKPALPRFDRPVQKSRAPIMYPSECPSRWRQPAASTPWGALPDSHLPGSRCLTRAACGPRERPVRLIRFTAALDSKPLSRHAHHYRVRVPSGSSLTYVPKPWLPFERTPIFVAQVLVARCEIRDPDADVFRRCLADESAVVHEFVDGDAGGEAHPAMAMSATTRSVRTFRRSILGRRRPAVIRSPLRPRPPT
ncbi:hypothetical protein BH20CHL7_BH20CHL7_05970 [soil metagenome]